uniref:Ubiquitin-conjugating enzyme E2C-binding protein n=1 Tax=Echinostoma caproni TaxID=27848 RepID=A0A183A328_9TREM
LSEILKQGTLLSFLQQSAPSPADPLGVEAKVMETYIRSCAKCNRSIFLDLP